MSNTERLFFDSNRQVQLAKISHEEPKHPVIKKTTKKHREELVCLCGYDNLGYLIVHPIFRRQKRDASKKIMSNVQRRLNNGEVWKTSL